MAKKKTVRRGDISPKRHRYDLEEIEPVVLVSKPKAERDGDEVEMIHVFTVDGIEYYMPRQVEFHVAMQSMEIAATQGEAAAVRFQLLTLLGEDGYRALVEFQDLESEHFTAIAAIANKIIMSSQESGKAR
jgi:hypothetical protein